jgi:hypothetical protein
MSAVGRTAAGHRLPLTGRHRPIAVVQAVRGSTADDRVEQSLGAVTHLSMPVAALCIGKVHMLVFQRLVRLGLRTLRALQNYLVMGLLLI